MANKDRRVSLCCDVGSTFNGDFRLVKEHIDRAADIGLPLLKFQLFQGKEYTNHGNIEFRRSWWASTVQYAWENKVGLFASGFDVEALDLIALACPIIKLAYSQSDNKELVDKAKALRKDKKVKIWASGDETKIPSYADLKMFCLPHYPPTTVLEAIPEGWGGFSSHYLGYDTDLRILDKSPHVTVLEKHCTLGKGETPDDKIALSYGELGALLKRLP